jgi:signal transduction histidine kinase
MKITREHTSLISRYVIGVLIIVGLSLIIFFLLMQPSIKDLRLMTLFLLITAFISIVAGYGAYRLGWIERSPTIRLTLMGGYALATILTFLNVWYTASRMFINEHDLFLALVLLIFASGIAMALGYFQTNALTDRINKLEEASHTIANGELNVRIPVKGNDELAELAKTFNQMAKKLEEAAAKQYEAERLRRDLIAWVSHDLQTPLSSIRAIIEALADGVVDDQVTIQRYLENAQKDIKALSVLIDDLFELAQIDAGGLNLIYDHISLSDLISDTLESFSQLASKKNIRIEGSVEPNLDPVYVDPQRIGRVMNNLINNAIRHTPDGGQVSVNASRSSKGVEIEVWDTGEGIPPEDVPYIFDRFYRGEKSRSRSTGGAGLGLAIAKGFVEAHEGNISVDSSLVEGTCFKIYIPD